MKGLTLIVDGDVEVVEEVKSIAHVSAGDKIRVPKDGLPKEKKIKLSEDPVGWGRRFLILYLFGQGFYLWWEHGCHFYGFIRFLEEKLQHFMSGLKRRECVVLHEVDVTNILSHDQFLKDMRFDRVVFNFPYAEFFKMGLWHGMFNAFPPKALLPFEEKRNQIGC